MIHVVLYEPEIPQNTGNIMRTCMASGTKLHLIEPLGFSLDEKHLRRAGMDYRKELDYRTYPNWEAFKEANPANHYYFVTRYGKVPPETHDFKKCEGDIYLVFGKESTGIPYELLAGNMDYCMRIPMIATARSLNLSNCVAIVVYEALKQLDYPGLERHECIKGEDFLDQWQEK